MQRRIAVILFVASFVLSVQAVASETTDQLARCVVFLRQNVSAGTAPEAGSGFLVAKGAEPYLITAAHVARAVGSDWTLIVQGSDGKAATAPMQNPSWQFSQRNDVAVLRLNPANDQKAFLLARSLPATILTSRPLPPNRDVTLTVMGYPLGIGVDGFVSPLSIETKAASGFVTLPRGDTKQPATFILLQNPSVGGLSGGPVFDTGLPYFGPMRQISVRKGVSVVGLMHGEIQDKGIGKLAAIVPGSEIALLLGISSEKQ